MPTFADIDTRMSSVAFQLLGDDHAALFTRKGESAAVAVSAMVDWRDVELTSRSDGRASDDSPAVIEHRPVLSLPASVRPVPRGSRVAVNGVTYTVDRVMSDDGQVIEAVCNA